MKQDLSLKEEKNLGNHLLLSNKFQEMEELL